MYFTLMQYTFTQPPSKVRQTFASSWPFQSKMSFLWSGYNARNCTTPMKTHFSNLNMNDDNHIMFIFYFITVTLISKIMVIITENNSMLKQHGDI